MAVTYAPALVSIGNIVNAFMLKRELPLSKFVPLLEHAFDCVRDHTTHTSRLYSRKTYAVSALGTPLVMPEDMVDFIAIALGDEKTLWKFTENSSMNVDELGPDKDIDDSSDSLGYGGRGGVNDYYYKLDWENRYIYLDGAEGKNVILFYISTGIRTDSETMVDVTMTSMINAYLYYRLGELEDESINELDRRNRAYENEVKLVSKHKLPPLNTIRDYFLKLTTQGITR